MEPNWAAEHLQIIRTLMERSAVYRRALAPVMLLLGFIGVGAMAAGLFFIQTPIAFGWYWMAVGIAAVFAALLMIRLQAVKASEAFWSPPTRRVIQAALPALTTGLLTGFLLTIFQMRSGSNDAHWLAVAWMVLYGCAIHAAGFFMPRGMKLFGWLFILAACLAGATFFWGIPSVSYAHILMGAAFGGLHLIYGIYLYFTEQRKNGA